MLGACNDGYAITLATRINWYGASAWLGRGIRPRHRRLGNVGRTRRPLPDGNSPRFDYLRDVYTSSQQTYMIPRKPSPSITASRQRARTELHQLTSGAPIRRYRETRADTLRPKRGVAVIHWFRFNSRYRQQGEKVAEYVAALRSHLAIHCDYGDSLDDMLRDRITCGTNDVAIQRRLQKPDIDF